MERIEQKFAELSVITNESVSDEKGPAFLTPEATEAAYRIHSTLPGYAATPLNRMRSTAAALGIRELFIKDESKRFGLNAFKGLGGLYALTALICRELQLDIETVTFQDLKQPALQARIRSMVFVTATDGNHGKGVAWAAGQLGCEAHIYMPVGSSERRAQAIRDVNPKADVTITSLGYDDAVRYAASQAAQHGWFLVQDTSWPGYEEIPSWILQGYTTMVREACLELEKSGITPTHVFLQAGVGAMAGSVTGYLMNRYEGRRPLVCVVEPENMACIYESARVNDGLPHPAVHQAPTIMAGLSCGEPCELTWPILRNFASWVIKCPDEVAKEGMRLLARPEGDDPSIVSGESGAVTVGLVNRIAGDERCHELKRLMGLDKDSVVLCFSTEGDTDPESYQSIVNDGNRR